MALRNCPACGRPQGLNSDCVSCRDAVAQGVVRAARDVTPEALPDQVRRAERFLARPPWYARAAPRALRSRLRLLWMVLRDWVNGSYRRLPWKAVAAIAAAVVWVLSPVDLVPDWLGPAGFADDLLAVAFTLGFVRRELRDYCAWKGLSPAHFGLE
jgi:uncharacterized membrane protein YkvA (DUF1232 family)